jgi:ubiquitin C-terminal hydrolase
MSDVVDRIDAFARFVHIPKARSHRARHCFFQDRDFMLDKLLWLRALPPDYTGCWSQEQTDHPKMTISVKLPSLAMKETEVFEVFVKDKYRDLMVQMPINVNHGALISNLTSPHCRQITPKYRKKGQWCLTYRPSVRFASKPNTNHPYDVFRRKVMSWYDSFIPGKTEKEGGKPDHADELLTRLFPDLALEMTQAAEKEQWIDELGKMLSELTGGSVVVQYTDVEHANAKYFGKEKGYLFSLTCIFPWAIEILMRRPNCLMTDCTFKSVHPYTLAILHAVIANESIPLGFGISPSEAWTAYDRIYQGICDLNVDLSKAGASGFGEEPDSRADDGEAPYPDDPVGIQDELAEPHPEEDDEPVGEVERLDESPMKVTDSNRHDGIRGILCSLPILTDQGAALKKFIGKWELTWKICHRHIIEAIGAGTQLGQWAARILQCFDEAEWKRTVQVIRREMDRLRHLWSEKEDGYPAFYRLLGYRVALPGKRDTHPLADRRRWALWERLGCPTTSNSAESVNGRLNAAIFGHSDWIDRLQIVARHLLERYRSRNTWCDRALKRNAAKCFPSPELQARPWFSASRRRFYLRLHNALHLTKAVKRRFSPEVARYMIWAQCSETLHGIFPFPESWEIPAPVSAGVPSADDPVGPIHLRLESSHTMKAFLAWQIGRTIAKLVGFAAWNDWGNQILTNIHTVAAELKVPDKGPVSEELEAEWRSTCRVSYQDWMRKPAAGGRTRAKARPTASPPRGVTQSSAPCEFSVPLPVPKPKGRKGAPAKTGRSATSIRAPPVRRASLLATPVSAPPPAPLPSPGPRVTPAPGFIGLTNIDGSCFVNAPLQCLMHVDPLHRYFDEDWPAITQRVAPQGSGVMAGAYFALQQAMDRAAPNPWVDSGFFLGALRHLRKDMMERAKRDRAGCMHSLLPALLDQLDVDVVNYNAADQMPREPDAPPPPKSSIIDELFSIKTDTQYTCQRCNKRSSEPRKQWCLSLSLPARSDSQPGWGIGPIRPQVSLHECMDAMKNGLLDGSRHCYASGCQRETGFRARCLISRLPPYLFIAVPPGLRTYSLTFPDEFDVTNYLAGWQGPNRTVCRLKAVIRYLSGGVGHYKAYIHVEGSWYCFNDSCVTKSDPRVPEGDPDLLMYECPFDADDDA